MQTCARRRVLDYGNRLPVHLSPGRDTMPAACLTIELHLPASSSLKDKRQVLRHLLDTARQRYRVAAAELDYQDLRQRSIVGFAAVAADVGQVEKVLDEVERFVWSHPEVEVVASERSWMEEP